MIIPVSVDFETFYSSKLKYGLKQMIAEQYVRHEMFDAYLLAVCDGSQSWAGHPREFNWNALDGQILLSHNRYFDNTVYNELVRREWVPKVNYKEWHCTANLTSYLCNRRALADSVEFLYKIKLDKSARANADGKRWPQDFSEQERIDMLKYAPADAYWCWRLWNDHSAKWPEIERRLSTQTINQGMYGVQINADLLDSYIIQTHEMKLNTEKSLPWIAGAEDPEWEDFGAKPTSTKCIAEECRRHGIPAPPVKAHEGEEAYLEWEITYSPKHPWIPALSSWRSVNRLYKMFMLMKSRLRNDGSMPFALKYVGAHTKRWSGDAKLNMQNQRKRPVVCNQSGFMETDDKKIDIALDEKEATSHFPEWVKYIIDFRSLIIPRPGTKMIVADLSQIEPRVLAWFVSDWELLDQVKSGASIYEAHARTTMGWTGGNLKKEDPEKYALAKARVLGLGYGCGWSKFISMAYDLARLDITVNDPEFIEERDSITGEFTRVSGYGYTSKKTVVEFRAQNPKITALWAKLDESFKRSIGENFIMTLPNGNTMTYEGVKASVKIEQDQTTGKPKKSWVFTAGIGGKRVSSYGGKLTENLVQAAARDVFSEHLIALEDAGMKVLYTVHDEVILEVDQKVTASDVEKIMSICPEWLEGCPIAAEAKVVTHYQK